MDNKIYFFDLNTWKWTKTDDLSTDKEPFYDFSFEGKLFVSEENTCPVCNAEKSLCVVASCLDEVSGIAKEWFCAACNKTGSVEQGFGQGDLEPRDSMDDHFFLLPSHVVITEDK